MKDLPQAEAVADDMIMDADKLEGGASDSAAQQQVATTLKAYPDFLRVWKGQSVSVFGSQMVAFAFSIWIYHETRSLIQFGIITAAQLIPTIILAPIAGKIIDKFSRRQVMLVCEASLSVVSLFLCYLAYYDNLNASNILYLSPIMASFTSVHQIAYSASVSQLVPKPMYGKANGLVQSGIHLSAVIIPLISVALLETAGLALILLLSIFTYALSALSLIMSQFPYQQDTSSQGKKAKTGESESFQGSIIRYLLQNRPSLMLIVFLCQVSFLNGVVLVLFRPMILTTMSSYALGWMVTLAGIGGLMGALLAGKLATREDKLRTLMFACLVSGLAMALCGHLRDSYMIATLAFIYSFSAPIGLVIAQTILQSITPGSLQGRIFASRSFFSTLALIMAVIIAPVLSELYFEPLMLEGQILAEKLGHLMGYGPGRGMALMFVLSGILMLSTTLIFSLSGVFRKLNLALAKMD